MAEALSRISGVYTLKNDKGFTLIELIVVMAILAVCTGIIAASVSTVSSSSAQKCANELNSAISRCRVNAMSRSGTVYLKVYRDSDGNVAEDYTESTAGGTSVSSDTIGSSGCGVTFTTDAEHSLDTSGTALYLSFDRGTGALRTLQQDGAGGVRDADSQCTSISVSGGGRTFTIRFFPATGAHTLEG